MKAPSLEEIYDFEKHIEGAIQQVLRSEDMTIHKQADSEELKTPYVTLQLQMGGSRGQKAKDRAGTWRDSAWDATMIAQIDTARSKQQDEHSTYKTRLMRVFPEIGRRINAEMLPFHVINLCKHAGTMVNIEAEEGIDRTQLTFTLVISVRRDVWPDVTS